MERLESEGIVLVLCCQKIFMLDSVLVIFICSEKIGGGSCGGEENEAADDTAAERFAGENKKAASM